MAHLTTVRALFLISLVSACAPSVLSAKPELPAPTGASPVGRMSFHWTDASRAEPLSAIKGARREVMVYLWYPADVLAGAPRANYLPDFAAFERCVGEAAMKKLLGGAGSTAARSGKLKPHASQNAKLSSSKKQYPLLVFSPGFDESSLTYSAMLEDLASHGYLVAAIDHPFDAKCVAFPDGRTVSFAQEKWDAAQKNVSGMMAYYASRIEVWALDTRFVLEQLIHEQQSTTPNAPFAGRIDLKRIGVFGHSVGGMTAARASELDDRFTACMNQDSDFEGKPFMPVTRAERIKQPFLFFVSEHSSFVDLPALTDEQLKSQGLTRAEYEKLIRRFAKNQDDALAAMPRGSYKVCVKTPGFTHRSFMDTGILKAADDPDRAVLAQQLGNLQLVRAYTRAFFDKHLKGMPITPLDQEVAPGARVKVDRFSAARAGR